MLSWLKDANVVFVVVVGKLFSEWHCWVGLKGHVIKRQTSMRKPVPVVSKEDFLNGWLNLKPLESIDTISASKFE